MAEKACAGTGFGLAGRPDASQTEEGNLNAAAASAGNPCGGIAG